MNTIDRYLLRQYIKNFVICFTSLVGLYVVFEFSTNAQDFVRCGEKTGNTFGLMGRYFGFKAILFFNETAGMLAMVAAMFTVSWIQRHNEMTALMAAGVSRLRILRSIFIAAGVVVFLAVADRELVIPQCRNELAKKSKDLIGDRPQAFDGCYDNQTDICISGKTTFANERKIVEPVFRMPPLLRDFGKQITADHAKYQDAEGDWPAGYLLENVQPKEIETRPSLYLNGRLVLLTPPDSKGKLKPNQCFLVSNLEFEQISGSGDERARMRKLASTRQMILNLRNPSLEFGAGVVVDIHSRIVQPLLDLTLIFLGLPLIVMRESRNVFVAMGMCMVLTSAFMGVVIGAQYLGRQVLIGPALAAWMPLLIFVPVAYSLTDSLAN